MDALERGLRDAAGTEGVAAERTSAAFAERAEREGLVDVGFGTLDTPVGTMMLAGTETGLVRVALPREDFDDALVDLSLRVSPRVLELPKRVDEARRELDEYFEGKRHEFDLPLDRQLMRGGFGVRVLEETSLVPFGSAVTYGEVAARAGNPRAQRAAGNALGSNPLPVIVPCHRVVRAGGDVGNYGGGPDMKRFLLRHEGWLT